MIKNGKAGIVILFLSHIKLFGLLYVFLQNHYKSNFVDLWSFIIKESEENNMWTVMNIKYVGIKNETKTTKLSWYFFKN